LFPHHLRNALVTLMVERVFEMRWTSGAGVTDFAKLETHARQRRT
jgi:hypothetical protein